MCGIRTFIKNGVVGLLRDVAQEEELPYLAEAAEKLEKASPGEIPAALRAAREAVTRAKTEYPWAFTHGPANLATLGEVIKLVQGGWEEKVQESPNRHLPAIKAAADHPVEIGMRFS